MNFKLALAAALACVAPAVVMGQQFDLLQPEQAFPLSATRDVNGDVLIMFDVRPGYALYKDRIVIKSNMQIASIDKPKGIPHMDEYFGYQEKYKSNTVVRVVPSDRRSPIEIYVKSQGCAEVGVCFSPLTRRIRLP